MVVRLLFGYGVVLFSMEELVKAKQCLYCPISVSDMATNNAKVRQNSLREYSHAQNAAYRAFCRGPGRPQTAAFGRVYFETPLNRRSLSPDRANFGDCVVASKATVEERSDDVAEYYTPKASNCPISQPIYTERRLLSRAKTAQRTLRHPAEELNDEEAIRITGSEQALENTVTVNNKEETNDFMIELSLDSGSELRTSDVESSEEIRKLTSAEDTLSDCIDSQLIVYHFVDNGCSCTAACISQDDPLAGCTTCSCLQQFLVSSYSVEMQGEGHQSTPGLGNCDSQENQALCDLLQKQLSLVCYRNQKSFSSS